MLYGAESWPMNSKIEQQITATEMKFLRKTANKTRRDHERNARIREELKTNPIVDCISTKQLKWYGHVKRMGKERIPRKCLEVRMEGKRSRGRPRTSWMDNINNHVKKRHKTMREADKLTQDRKEWRKFTESPTP